MIKSSQLGGGGYEVNDAKPIHTLEDLVVDGAGTWLRTGVVSTDVASYPKATKSLLPTPNHLVRESVDIDTNATSTSYVMFIDYTADTPSRYWCHTTRGTNTFSDQAGTDFGERLTGATGVMDNHLGTVFLDGHLYVKPASADKIEKYKIVNETLVYLDEFPIETLALVDSLTTDGTNLIVCQRGVWNQRIIGVAKYLPTGELVSPLTYSHSLAQYPTNVIWTPYGYVYATANTAHLTANGQDYVLWTSNELEPIGDYTTIECLTYDLEEAKLFLFLQYELNDVYTSRLVEIDMRTVVGAVEPLYYDGATPPTISSFVKLK